MSLSFSFLLVSFSFVSFPFFSSYYEADSVTSGLLRQFICSGHGEVCSAQEKESWFLFTVVETVGAIQTDPVSFFIATDMEAM